MSSDQRKIVTDDDLREIFVDLVDTKTPDDAELEDLAKLSGLGEADVRDGWRELEARLDPVEGLEEAEDELEPQPSAEAAPGLPGSPHPPPADLRRIGRRPRTSFSQVALSFVLGAAAALLLTALWPEAPEEPSPPRLVYLEPASETDVLRGSDEDRRHRAEPRRLILLLAPPTVADRGERLPETARFELRAAATGDVRLRGETRRESQGYLVEVPEGHLDPDRYEVRIFAAAGPDPVATYELVIQPPEDPDEGDAAPSDDP